MKNHHPINCHVYFDYNKGGWALVIEDDGTIFEHSKTWYKDHAKVIADVEKLNLGNCFVINLLEYPDQNYYSSTIPEEIHRHIIDLNIGPTTFPEHFLYEQQ